MIEDQTMFFDFQTSDKKQLNARLEPFRKHYRRANISSSLTSSLLDTVPLPPAQKHNSPKYLFFAKLCKRSAMDQNDGSSVRLGVYGRQDEEVPQAANRCARCCCLSLSYKDRATLPWACLSPLTAFSRLDSRTGRMNYCRRRGNKVLWQRTVGTHPTA